jgi:hypothetical protein
MMKRNRQAPRVNNDSMEGGIPNEAIVLPAVMAGFTDVACLLQLYEYVNFHCQPKVKRNWYP